MALNEQELSLEQNYLNTVFDRINGEIDHLEEELKAQYDTIVNANKSFKEDVPILNGGADFDQVVEIYKFNDIVEAEEHHYNSLNARLRVLRQMQNSAYFGKIDFLEYGEHQSDKYYIGIGTLMNDDADFLVLDWRAPVCNLYYEYESGKCEYECPAGIIKGELLSKRQFGIQRNEIKFAFDTDLLIEDRLLCKVLSESRDKKMGNIVKSIQKEQNTAIRMTGTKNLVVFGPAGSGKTSVAMHRAAFLLYKHRDTVKSQNVLILSPNNVFKNYISDVLPDLGEADVNISTIIELFKPMLNGFNVFSHSELMESIINNKTPDTEKRIKYAKFKNSAVFLEIMNRYADFIDDQNFAPHSILFNGSVIISAEEIKQLYYNDWASMPYSQRLKRIRSRAMQLLDEVIEKYKHSIELENMDLMSWEIEELTKQKINQEFSPIISKINNMLSINAVTMYANMFKSYEFFQSIQDIIDFDFSTFKDMLNPETYFNKHNIYWEDIFGLLYVKCIINGERPQFDDTIKFVFMDEFQDIPPVGLFVLQKVFSGASLTLVGDINQTIDPTAHVYNDNTLALCLEKSTDIFKLTKSYRSTIEITDFANKIIADNNIEYMDRHGDEVEIHAFLSDSDKIQHMLQSITSSQEKGLHSIGIICKNQASASTLYNKIKLYANVALILSDKDPYSSGITVIPSYLSKGLEFDSVYIYDADSYSQDDIRLYYTVCTRAMHKLTLYK